VTLERAGRARRLRKGGYLRWASEHYAIEVNLEGEWFERTDAVPFRHDLAAVTERARTLHGKPFPARVVLIRTSRVEVWAGPEG